MDRLPLSLIDLELLALIEIKMVAANYLEPFKEGQSLVCGQQRIFQVLSSGQSCSNHSFPAHLRLVLSERRSESSI
jgi:hypothetical protein